MTKTRVLLCGSEGYLGQSLIDQFLKAPDQYEVFGVDIGPRGRLKGSYKFLGVDLTDAYSVDNIFEQAQPQIVINAAATIYGVGGFHANPAKILSNDLQLHINLLKAFEQFREFGAEHFVYISSSMVYEGRFGGDEETPLMLPNTDYGLSKLTGERLVKAYNQQYGVPYTIYRPFNIINPYEMANDKSAQGTHHVFADFLNNIVVQKKSPLPIIGDGSQIRCFTWHEDVASGIVQNLNKAETLNQTFNLGSTEAVTMRNLAKMIVEIAKKNGYLNENYALDFETVKSYADDVKTRIPEVMKAKEILGWEATTNLTNSIEACMHYLMANLPSEPELKYF